MGTRPGVHMQTNHPGVTYDPTRNRYRVKVYKGTIVAHLSYHSTLDEAVSKNQEIRGNIGTTQKEIGNSDLDWAIKFLRKQ